MKSKNLLLLGAVIALAGWAIWKIQVLENKLSITQIRARTPVSNSNSVLLEARLKKLEKSSPHAGEIMCGIQLHFGKLYFAGEAKNWDLARFEKGELEEGLDALIALRPEENGVNLAGITDAFKNTQLAALTDAIGVKDRSLFRDAYNDSVAMCNACHQSTGRPFISIIVPTNPPVTNQRWEAPSFSQ